MELKINGKTLEERLHLYFFRWELKNYELTKNNEYEREIEVSNALVVEKFHSEFSKTLL